MREFERGLTMKKIITESLPISEVKRHVKFSDIARAVDIALTRLVGQLNLKWNLNDNQIQTIVMDLLDRYPNESIEDFILCFKKARQGEYGELMRLDSAIVFTWMEKYLDEKYKVLEDEYRKSIATPTLPDEPTGEGYELFKKWAKELATSKDIKPIFDEDIKREGKEHIKKRATSASAGYAYYTVRGISLMATDQAHAERLVKEMIERGELIEGDE